MPIHYVTGNNTKFNYAKSFFDKKRIDLVQTKLDISEIQSSDPISIAESKANQAWKKIKEPLFVSDSYWMIPALNGFPGPYMKDINLWFTPQDFLNLMKDKKDRTIILKDTIFYIDNQGFKTFTNDYSGIILEKACGSKYLTSIDAIASFSDSKKAIAEETSFSFKEERIAWNNFVDWLKLRD